MPLSVSAEPQCISVVGYKYLQSQNLWGHHISVSTKKTFICKHSYSVCSLPLSLCHWVWVLNCLPVSMRSGEQSHHPAGQAKIILSSFEEEEEWSLLISTHTQLSPPPITCCTRAAFLGVADPDTHRAQESSGKLSPSPQIID